MPLPYDPSRRGSIGGGPAGSPPQPNQQGLHALAAMSQMATDTSKGSHELPPPPPHFHSRQMPPPSPPNLPSSASSLSASAPRGPPNASPFPSVRDLSSFQSHRPGGGMSISSILGGGDERNPPGSPNAANNAAPTPKSMPPPSPARARSSSMREPGARGFREASPPRNIGPDHRLGTGPDRAMNEPRRDGMFGAPQYQHGFRAFQPMQMEQRPGMNGQGAPGRPSSQPIDNHPPRNTDNIARREPPYEGRFATFRHFGEPQAPQGRGDMGARHDVAPFHNGEGPTSQPGPRKMYHSPQMERQRSQTGPNFRPGMYGTPMREDQAGLFRPSYQQGLEGLREPMASPRFQDLRRGEMPRSSPPLSDLAAAERIRLSLLERPPADRPMTFEEHQRMELMHREQQQNRKESDGSAHRALLNISPELNRKGRNSPLPQAVQGAQPRYVGPGGDNPGIKMEFGRMFPGLGSGVGTATPTAGQSANGTTTPSRMSPARHVEGGDLVRTAVAEIENGRGGTKSGGRGGRKNARHRVEEDGRMNGNGTDTPDNQRSTKRSKTNHAAHHHHHVHPRHHHHHHHHDPIDNGSSPFNTLRFPSATPAAPHPHHHHTSHAHPGHHHHHAPRASITRKPTTTVMSRRLVEEAAKKPRKHLGSQVYTSELSMAPAGETPLDAKIKFSSKMRPIPRFDGKENCTYTVRVPRLYLGGISAGGEKSDNEYFQEICKHRNVWGTDVYTDDSDVIAAAVHAGWIKGDFGDYNDDIREICGNESEQDEPEDNNLTTLAIKPRRPVKVPPGCDAQFTLLILPPLESYASTNQHHIWSREWKGSHDGMSYIIHRIDFVEESSTNRLVERSAMGRKQRLAMEEAKRREAAAGLLMFAGGGGGDVRVGA
ncbi:uncharacterized protein LTR77_000865 [Saxophila tyrrhenica]|uniref:Rxt3-domain-containing protein n=1 Tax=Saxophila tyrrhenica TaxID=1690608 RepID=A0AAV9PPI5_9PEZI|nr:hypothetical protein LTR77_000865 [Saxophila tyrrhenica]